MTKRTNLSYTRLENDLRQDILSNRLSGGEALPTEKELSDQYGISRNTVRHALANLVDEGLLSKVHGSGTFVVPAEERCGGAVKRGRNQILFLSFSSAMSEYTFRAENTFEPIFTGLNGVLRKRGYNLMLTQVELDWVPPQCLVDGEIAGLVFHGPADIEFWRKYIRPFPHVGIQYHTLALDSNFVALDNHAFSVLCLKYLMQHGHRRIAFLTDEIENQISYERYQGYLQGLRELDLPYDERYQLVWQRPYVNGVLPPCFEAPDYTGYLQKAFREGPPPTAIVCTDDSRAEFARLALEKLGLRVPADISLTGSYNMPFSRDSRFAGVCTMLNPICSEAAGLLLDQIENPDRKLCKTVLIRPEFTTGDSVAVVNENNPAKGKFL
ncbi:MAG: LacI family DNA-binding transcriptional regulator [Lentisphaeria bacterium]|nr:LacI family DNA-binding transcriptional regulator [Lentisphaeria bacterium]